MQQPPTVNQVLAWIGENESHTIEFKLERETQPDISETLAAFANAEGGVILFGVGDNQSIVGVRDVKTITLRILAAARNVTPRLDETIRVDEVEVEGKRVVVVLIPDELVGTYLAGATYRIRHGAQNVLMSAEAIVEHVHSRGSIPFDRRTIQDTGIDDFDQDKLLAFLRRRGHNTVAAMDVTEPSLRPLLRNLQILGGDEGREQVTVAGLLMFGKQPQQRLPQSILQCARFLGTETTRFLDRVEVTGSIEQQVESGMDFVARNIRHGTVIEGIHHVDVDEYPMPAIREALVNALCHRDYYHPGSVVNLSVFDDRILIINPGGLLPGLRVEELEGSHKLRNSALGLLMYDAGLIERWGSGITRMRSAMQASGLSVPLIEANRDEFRITFRGPREGFLRVGQPATGLTNMATIVTNRSSRTDVLPPLMPRLNMRQRALLNDLEGGLKSISRDEYEQAYNVSSRTAKRDLSELVALGLIERVGESSSTRYMPLPNNASQR